MYSPWLLSNSPWTKSDQAARCSSSTALASARDSASRERPAVVSPLIQPTFPTTQRHNPLPVSPSTSPHNLTPPPLRKSHVRVSPPPPHTVQFPSRGHGLQPILADDRQHQQAWFLSLLCHLAQQALVHERRHPVQHVCWPLTQSSIDPLHCFQCAAAGKDGEVPEEPLLPGIKQIIAPRNCVAQSLLP